jgi:hypothetical protein
MKNKTIYLLVILFSLSLLSAARKNKSVCGKYTIYEPASQLEFKQSADDTEKNADIVLPAVFFLNI